MVPITEQEEPKQAPPPPEAPKVEEVLQIAENDADIEESTIQSSEASENQAVEIKYVPEVVEEEEVEELMSGFDKRIQTLAEFAENKTAIVGMCTSGGFNILGNDGRCSLIGNEIGFENVGVDSDTATSTHGNEASFEFVVERNPEYIFVMDRDAAINTEGAQLAQEIVENELVMGTDAYKNGHIVYLKHPAVWYTAEGGINALDIMLQDLEGALL